MDQHNFETQIKNQLDGLAMSPSPMVWQRIERQLPNQKRSRKGAWLAIAAVLIVGALGAGSYYLLNNNVYVKGITKNQEKSTSTINPISKPSIINNRTTNKRNKNIIAKITTQSNQPLKKAIDYINTKLANNNDNEIFAKKNIMRYNKNIHHTITNKNKGNEYTAANSAKDALRKYPTEAKNIPLSEPRLEKSSIVMYRPELTLADISNIKIMVLNLKKVEPTITTPPIESHKKQTMGWSMHMTNGVSWQANKSSNIASTSAVDYGTIIYGNMSGGKQPTQKTAYAYSVGANVSFPLSDRLSVGGGVSYVSLSTRVQLGEAINAPYVVNQGNQGSTTIYSYYQAEGTKNTYTTQQQSLQIPVSVEWEALHQKHFPVWLTAGVSMLKQISASDILYDPTTNVSHKTDNTTMNDIQWQLTFGAKTTLWQKNKLSVQAGPYYEVGLGNIYKESLLQHGNWKMIGLKAQFNFGGK